jgi:hypothetical protein
LQFVLDELGFAATDGRRPIVQVCRGQAVIGGLSPVA